MSKDSQTDGMMVSIVDKNTGKARVSWDGESKQQGQPARTAPLPMPENEHEDIDFKE